MDIPELKGKLVSTSALLRGLKDEIVDAMVTRDHGRLRTYIRALSSDASDEWVFFMSCKLEEQMEIAIGEWQEEIDRIINNE